jgi:hypothetical protein
LFVLTTDFCSILFSASGGKSKRVIFLLIVAMTTLHYDLGVWWIKKRRRVKEKERKGDVLFALNKRGLILFQGSWTWGLQVNCVFLWSFTKWGIL